MGNSTGPPRKRLPTMTTVSRPVVSYAVQRAFTKTKRIFLINPSTLQYVNGLINLPSLHLTFTRPQQVKTRKVIGFLPIYETIPIVPSEIKIDATLYFSSPTEELFAGYDEESGLNVVVIKVGNDEKVKTWRRIAQRVATSLMVEKQGELYPTVFFQITSSFLQDPKSPQLPKTVGPSPFFSYMDAVNSNDYYPEDDEDEYI